MKHATARRVITLAIAAVLAALVIAGCAKKPMWGDPETGLILTYRMQKDQALTYRYTNDFAQHLDVMGQTIEITAECYRNFDFLSIQPAVWRSGGTGDIRMRHPGSPGRSRFWTASRCSRHCPVHIEPVQQA